MSCINGYPIGVRYVVTIKRSPQIKPTLINNHHGTSVINDVPVMDIYRDIIKTNILKITCYGQSTILGHTDASGFGINRECFQLMDISVTSLCGE